MHPVQALTRPALLLLLCLLYGGLHAAHAQATQPCPLPTTDRKVNDYANVIDEPSKARMETMLQNLDQRAQIEFGVVTIQSLGGQDVFDYSLRVMRCWGIGTKEKGGLLILFALDERKGFVQVSRHLEGDLPDSLVGAVARKYMREPFQRGQYGAGLLAGAESFIATLGQKRGFSVEGIDPGFAVAEPRQTGYPQRGSRGSRPKQGSFSVCGIAFIVLIILFFMMAGRGRGGGGGSGCLNLLLLNSLLNSGRGGSGWGGGSFGGSGGSGGWGGGSGGFGGFSGGGGDAGGGGAGFDW
ncbi:MAG TPA: TPM domain-containing protein [Pyrinomonadaceae bacterium]|nr:TPM domain-containing protein [Pyrinomonadaceae bacterium]